MMTPSFTAKEISTSHGDRLIRVLTITAKNNSVHALTFHESEIQGVAQMAQDRSALVLRSGAEIPVALPYEKLEQKIYSPSFRTDGLVLDLRDVTGEAAKPFKALAGASDAPANTNQGPAPGDKMPDGTIFAGVSPDTGKAMYATPADASLSMKFNKAREYAARLDAHGHKDWRVPTKAELNVLFNNRAAIVGDITGPADWYWSSSPGSIFLAWGQCFSDGCQSEGMKLNHASVRCVR